MAMGIIMSKTMTKTMAMTKAMTMTRYRSNGKY